MASISAAKQGARAGDRGELGDAVGAAFGAVGSAKSVVHKDVAQAPPCLRAGFAVLSSPTLTRQFSSITNWRRAATCNALDPVRHQRNGRGPATHPSACSHRRSASQQDLKLPSVGRPRWLVTMTAAPASRAIRIHGTDARMRVLFGNGPAAIAGAHSSPHGSKTSFAAHLATGTQVRKNGGFAMARSDGR
jgi:hypothetical protein